MPGLHCVHRHRKCGHKNPLKGVTGDMGDMGNSADLGTRIGDLGFRFKDLGLGFGL